VFFSLTTTNLAHGSHYNLSFYLEQYTQFICFISHTRDKTNMFSNSL